MVLTGAGVSAESGVPTFRGAGGFWREFQAQDLASPEAFQHDPSVNIGFEQKKKNYILMAKYFSSLFGNFIIIDEK